MIKKIVVTQVVFVGEDAVDAGGVRKEFFLLIMKELLDPKYGMFRYYEESRLIWFSHKVRSPPAARTRRTYPPPF